MIAPLPVENASKQLVVSPLSSCAGRASRKRRGNVPNSIKATKSLRRSVADSRLPLIGSTVNMENLDRPQETRPFGLNSQVAKDRLYVFVGDEMNIGGIETLLVRMANQVAELGYPVVVMAKDGPCMSSLSHRISAIRVDERKSIFSHLKQLPTAHLTPKTKVFIWAAIPYALVSIYKYQRHLYQKTGAKSVSVSGIFGPARSYQSLKHRLEMMRHRLVLGWLPRDSVYFMSKTVQDTYIAQFGSSFARWPIHKLSLDISDAAWRPREGNVLKIVSIGRITKFKPYNFGALDVLDTMREKNIAVHWSIWGHGDESELLEKSIRDRGLSSYVTFEGALPYSQFKPVALGSDLFVGMGTAALEAALVGVPTVVALTWSRLGTYGFLHQCPDDSIGEHCTGHEETSLIDIILSYGTLSQQQRLEISSSCREAALRKTSAEPAPFDAMFEGGINCPSSRSVSIRMLAFGAAQSVWVISKSLVGFVKTIGRVALGKD